MQTTIGMSEYLREDIVLDKAEEISSISSISFSNVSFRYHDEADYVLSNFNLELMSGTSQATALPAGYIALIRDYHIRNDVSLSNEDIFGMLQYLDSNERQDVDYLSPFRFSFD